MGMPKHLMLVIALTYCTSTLWAQYIDTLPRPPTLDYITNDLFNGDITIYWTKPRLNRSIPILWVYNLYSQITRHRSWVPIDTVDKILSICPHSANGNGQRVYYRLPRRVQLNQAR
jgi:hypothetical protein